MADKPDDNIAQKLGGLKSSRFTCGSRMVLGGNVLFLFVRSWNINTYRQVLFGCKINIRLSLDNIELKENCL